MIDAKKANDLSLPRPALTNQKSGRRGMTAVAVLTALFVWTLAATLTSPFFLPSPLSVGNAIVDLTVNGIGEGSKIAIIIYTSLFTVFMNTMAGATTVDESPSRAALCLGATKRQVLWRVVLPATVPAILVGMRVGMGFSFMSVVAAEMIAANEGVGFLIYNARLFLKTANAFAGILTLGAMGLLADYVFRLLARKLFPKHALPF